MRTVASLGTLSTAELEREQMQLVTTQAMKAGFTGGLVIDYPNSTKAKKLVSRVCSPPLALSLSLSLSLYLSLALFASRSNSIMFSPIVTTNVF